MIDVDWTTKPKPCQTEGCDWPRWHVCLVGKADHTNIILNRINRSEAAKRGAKNRGPFVMTDLHKESLAIAQRERWARVREENQERDLLIVELYSDMSMNQLAERFEMSRNGVNAVLTRAQDEGRVIIRKRGYNVRYETHPKKE